jgi:peptide deformylase
MMKIWLWGILLGISISVNAQKFEKYSKAEKVLIESNSTEMMRVTQLPIPEDSVILKSVSKPVKPNHKLSELLYERMLKSVQDPENTGVGIAAPQVGINRRMILVQRFDKPNKPYEVFINPEIIWASDLMQIGPEGDLSFEDRGLVYRHYAIQIRYQNLKGKTITENLEGFTSVIFQHERDHLDGILLIDRITEQKGKNYDSYPENRLFLTK